MENFCRKALCVQQHTQIGKHLSAAGRTLWAWNQPSAIPKPFHHVAKTHLLTRATCSLKWDAALTGFFWVRTMFSRLLCERCCASKHKSDCVEQIFPFEYTEQSFSPRVLEAKRRVGYIEHLCLKQYADLRKTLTCCHAYSPSRTNAQWQVDMRT